MQEEPVAPSTVNRSLTPAMDALVARALKKNPNERFPSAAAMQDEIARVLSAGGQTGAPVIVGDGNAPANSGSGVGSAVFPPVDQSAPAPAPHSVQTPYQPGPYQSQPGPYGPATPAPATNPSYGYPQTPAPAYQSPAPMQHQTPAPYTVSPQTAASPASGGAKRNMPVIISAIVVALVAIGGLITVIALNGDEKDKGGTDAKTTESPSGDHRDPERNRTMKTEKCTDASEDTNDPQKVDAPNFMYKGHPLGTRLRGRGGLDDQAEEGRGQRVRGGPGHQPVPVAGDRGAGGRGTLRAGDLHGGPRVVPASPPVVPA